MELERGFAEPWIAGPVEAPRPVPITDPDATTRVTACVWFPDKWVTRDLECGLYVAEFRTSDGAWHSFALSVEQVRGLSAAFAAKLCAGI